jgi:hemolysin III
MFLASAAYHLVRVHPGLTRLLQRLDHSAIFVGIGGLYTPFCLQGLWGAWGIALLAVVWGLAGAGILVRQFTDPPPWACGLVYGALGWTALAAAPVLASELGGWTVAKLAGAGLVYSLGAVTFAIRRPDPFPRFFGYHEVFHLLVTLATAAMYTVVLTEVLPR